MHEKQVKNCSLYMKYLSKHDCFCFCFIILLSTTAVSLGAEHCAGYFKCAISESHLTSSGANKGSERVSGRTGVEN